MSLRNKNNSILFLTTLSVYLGLVLVGSAMSPVLAQAATARNFNVQDEIEVKDDLDKNPDGNLLFTQSIVKLIEKLDALAKADKFDWSAENIYEIEDFEFCKEDTGKLLSFVSDGSINREVDFELGKISAEIARNFFAKTAALNIGGKYDRTIDYKFSFGKNALDFQAQLAFDNAQNARLFSSELNKRLVSASKPVKEIVAENTKISFQNNQVFVVTLLPRAAIDALLAKNAQKRGE